MRRIPAAGGAVEVTHRVVVTTVLPATPARDDLEPVLPAILARAILPPQRIGNRADRADQDDRRSAPRRVPMLRRGDNLGPHRRLRARPQHGPDRGDLLVGLMSSEDQIPALRRTCDPSRIDALARAVHSASAATYPVSPSNFSASATSHQVRRTRVVALLEPVGVDEAQSRRPRSPPSCSPTSLRLASTPRACRLVPRASR